MELKVGIKNECRITVTDSLTAHALGSGLLPVFSTPSLVALMERTCAESVQVCLTKESVTVGISLDVEHTSATPVGVEVRCESELVEIDRRMLVFRVTAYDPAGEIGRGTHKRFIVDSERFMEKVKTKLK